MVSGARYQDHETYCALESRLKKKSESKLCNVKHTLPILTIIIVCLACNTEQEKEVPKAPFEYTDHIKLTSEAKGAQLIFDLL